MPNQVSVPRFSNTAIAGFLCSIVSFSLFPFLQSHLPYNKMNAKLGSMISPIVTFCFRSIKISVGIKVSISVFHFWCINFKCIIIIWNSTWCEVLKLTITVKHNLHISPYIVTIINASWKKY